MPVVVLVLLLIACGGNGSSGGRIAWQEGTPPRELATQSARVAQTLEEGPTTPTTPPGSAPTTVSLEKSLSPAQRVALRPNELGVVPVLMYHDIVDLPATDAGYTRTLGDCAAEIRRLYAENYYVVPLRDLVLDRIAAPAGKHPVVLTFDDGIANQFLYLIGADGSLRLDPTSAVGVLESFFAAHPDFGRGGYFAVPPKTCFDWTAAGAEPDQTPCCAQKLAWLLDHGYEVGDHTLDHADLLDLSDDDFRAEVGGAWVQLRALAPQVEPDQMAMPFGNYPDPDKHPEQRAWLRGGFSYEGTTIKIIAGLMVGADPSPAPVSTDWEPLFIPRIQAYAGDYGSDQWLALLGDGPERLYTSDGDPTTITVPTVLPPSLAGTLDREQAVRDGKRIVEYDPTTGEPA